MKKLSYLSLVAVLAVGLLSVGALAEEISDNTYVSWNYTCNAQILAHDPIEEGEIAPDNSNNLIFNDGNTRPVRTASNCPYELNVIASENYSPAGAGSFLYNFYARFDDVDSGTINMGSWQALGYNSKDVGSVDLSQAQSTSGWNNWDVRYYFDADGKPAGNYRVDLTYTLSTLD